MFGLKHIASFERKSRTEIGHFVALKRWVNKHQEYLLCRMDMRQVFAANLIRARRAKGLSQETLAYEADVNRTYISKLEKGSTWVGLEVVSKLSAVLGVEPADLLQKPPKRATRRKVE
jgi:ribosome-binding protein aMBF1 (putative translation factor)